MAKRLISMLLILTLLLAPMTVAVRAADVDPEIGELVREQYEAFAKARDFYGSDERALWDMINHALYGRGKDLVFDNQSAMTAVMLNSEMYKATMTEALTAAVTQLDWFSMDEMTLYGNARWYDYQMRHQWVGYDEYGNYRGEMLKEPVYTGIQNDNDLAMILVVGSATSQVTIRREEVTDEETVYRVEFYLADVFDFDNTYEDMEDLGFDVTLAETLTNIGKLLALGLIDEYKWCVEADFQLRIPNRCDHAGKTYEWGFWRDIPYAVTWNGGAENEVEEVTEKTDSGTAVYYKLEETVHLFHDKPWVVEFEADSKSVLTLASTSDTTEGYPYLMKDDVATYRDDKGMYYRQTVLGGQYRMAGLTERDRNVLGVEASFMELDVLSGADYECRKDTGKHLFRLENHVAEDGSNMVMLYVDQEYVAPLDEYYLYVRDRAFRSGRRTTDDISGLDFEINYIGDRDHPLEEGIYALRIWENGIGRDESMVDEGTFYEPTCTEEGYFAYACRICHRKYPTYFVEPAGHRFEQDLKLTWNVRTGSHTSHSLCSDCGEIGPAHEFSCVVQPDDDGYLQLRIHPDALEKSAITVTSQGGSMNLTIPEEDFWLEMMAVSYDSDGRMTDVQFLSAEELTMLPLQNHTIKLLFLNKYTRAPLMPALQVNEG